ncbi:N-acetyltransferase [Oceanobacillus piezotolerans]|uniref:N-acetyltransferase n=1 Tax=Oceanobacillus piezotolerans TaxID=2448030 RepID=A0A498DE02_9BACI|nr:GNAT family protein [Oceanobacillus piezotolerans]RLL48306.1 N-acetyltransferase [Oceanobacillus piezotolerans]
MSEHIIDNDVSLRMFTEDDAEEYYHLIINSKEHLKRWIAWVGSVENEEDTNISLKLRMEEVVENSPKWFAINYKGKMAGTIGFNEVDTVNRVGELGYWLGKDFQGKGIMLKACKAILDYGFKELSLNRIEVYIAVGNERSRALPEQLGFLEEGRIRQAEWIRDRYEDQVIYGILAKEWG